MTTDNLLAGISDDLENKLDLFLINYVEHDPTKEKIVEFMNSAFREGMNKAIVMLEEEGIEKRRIALENLREENAKFLDEYNKKLLDGQDTTVSK